MANTNFTVAKWYASQYQYHIDFLPPPLIFKTPGRQPCNTLKTFYLPLSH